jgi:hypothetical protein
LGFLCFLIMAMSLVMGVFLILMLMMLMIMCLFFLHIMMLIFFLHNLKHRLIAPGHHFLNRFLLILFDPELINIQSVGPLFTAWFLQV